MEEGKSFLNYYWMEGPLPDYKGKRVIVLHNNQPSQCINCLRRSSEGCPSMGLGKACDKTGTPRTKDESVNGSGEKKYRILCSEDKIH